MPELPDVVVYVEALQKRLRGQRLRAVRLNSPFLLRSVNPPLEDACERAVVNIGRIGKRITIEMEGRLYLVFHLMIAGRLHWRKPGTLPTRKYDLATFDFTPGTLLLTEAGSRKRASLTVVQGNEALVSLDPGGLEVLEASQGQFRKRLLASSHTLKRALTDPRILSGIGNSYSDEILHAARLSPFRLTSHLTEDELHRLFDACRSTLTYWVERLRRDTGDQFPEKVTAFREGMAVHGRYRQPCPVCATPIQRIVYAENESNYCPYCQTQGRLLADRALSRLLKDDWPRSLEELESRIESARNQRPKA